MTIVAISKSSKNTIITLNWMTWVKFLLLWNNGWWVGARLFKWVGGCVRLIRLNKHQGSQNMRHYKKYVVNCQKDKASTKILLLYQFRYPKLSIINEWSSVLFLLTYCHQFNLFKGRRNLHFWICLLKHLIVSIRPIIGISLTKTYSKILSSKIYNTQ